MALRGPFRSARAELPFLKRIGRLRGRDNDAQVKCLSDLFDSVVRGDVSLKHNDWDGDPHKYLLFCCGHDVRVYARDRGRVTFISATPAGQWNPVEELL